jgi:hypothetical protein
MTLAELKRRLPARTLATLVAGLVVAVGFVAVFLIPEYRAAAALRLRIAALRSDIEIQRQLAPVRANLKKIEASLPSGNLRVEPEPLPLSEIGQLAVIMGGMAKPLGLTVDSVSPDASSVGKKRPVGRQDPAARRPGVHARIFAGSVPVRAPGQGGIRHHPDGWGRTGTHAQMLAGRALRRTGKGAQRDDPA